MPSAPPGIGTKLRNARVERELSIEESAWRTRMRPDLLRALEDEEFDSIGHLAFVRTHLSSYARFLGMDATEVVQEFEAKQPDPLPSSIEELDRKVRDAPKPRRPKWIIAAIVSGAGLIAAAAVGVLGGQVERPAAPSVASVAASASSTPITAGPIRVRIAVEVVRETQVSIIADGEQIFEGTLAAGSRRAIRARRMVEIFAADGGAIRITFNGKHLGVAGDSGSVFRARYNRRGRIDG